MSLSYPPFGNILGSGLRSEKPLGRRDSRPDTHRSSIPPPRGPLAWGDAGRLSDRNQLWIPAQASALHRASACRAVLTTARMVRNNAAIFRRASIASAE
jgi:hypothetical protein